MTNRTPLAGPNVWTGAEIKNSKRWIRDMPASAVAELDAALRIGDVEPRVDLRIVELDARFDSLQDQALGALLAHAEIQNPPEQRLLDGLASFQRILFSSESFSATRAFIAGS